MMLKLILSRDGADPNIALRRSEELTVALLTSSGRQHSFALPPRRRLTLLPRTENQQIVLGGHLLDACGADRHVINYRHISLEGRLPPTQLSSNFRDVL